CRSQRGAEQRRRDVRTRLEPNGLQRPGADFVSNRVGQCYGSLGGELLRRKTPQQWPREMREARIGSDQIDQPLARWSDDIDLLLEHRQCDLDAWDLADLVQPAFVETARTARIELELGIADDLSRELRDRVRQALACDLRRKQQRYAYGDPENRKALLYQRSFRAQPRAVEGEDVPKAHPRHRFTPWLAEGRMGPGRAPAGTRRASRRAVRAPGRQSRWPAGRASRARPPLRARGRARAAGRGLRECAACPACPWARRRAPALV